MAKLIDDEDFREDCKQAALEEGVHPKLRRHRPETKGHCRACARPFDPDELTEDELCPGCNNVVEALERGKIEQPKETGGPKKAARCSQCKLICWEDEIIGDLCPECYRQHVGEVKGDDVG